MRSTPPLGSRRSTGEGQTGALYLEKPSEVRDYTLKFDYLRAEAHDPAQSARLIAGLAKEKT